jgi:hypothetical protein
MRDSMFLSGDYFDATNCIRAELSSAAAESISSILCLGPLMTRLFCESLTDHTYVKTFKEGYSLELNQKGGQLMGSITSFIVLCMVNAAICGSAIEISRKRYRSLTLRHMPLMINGDDCLFLANRNCRDLWSIFGKIAGLEPSVGKCYYSKDFLQINSQNFMRVNPYVFYRLTNTESDWPDAQPYWSNFKRIGKVLISLVEGNPRSVAKGCDTDFFKIANLQARQSEILNLCPPELRQSTNNYFYQVNHELISSSGVPWYVDPSYGGLGLRPKDLEKTSEDCISQIDRRICNGIKFNCFKSSFKTPLKLSAKDKWTINSYKEKVLRNYGVEYTHRDYEQLVLSEFERYLTISLLFSRAEPKCVGIKRSKAKQFFYEDVVKPTPNFMNILEDGDVEEMFSKDIARNSRFWRSAHLPRYWKDGRGVGSVSDDFDNSPVFPHLCGLRKLCIDSDDINSRFWLKHAKMICEA